MMMQCTSLSMHEGSPFGVRRVTGIRDADRKGVWIGKIFVTRTQVLEVVIVGRLAGKGEEILRTGCM